MTINKDDLESEVLDLIVSNNPDNIDKAFHILQNNKELINEVLLPLLPNYPYYCAKYCICNDLVYSLTLLDDSFPDYLFNLHNLISISIYERGTINTSLDFVNKFPKLEFLGLKNFVFSKFPRCLFDHPNLKAIDFSNTNISEFNFRLSKINTNIVYINLDNTNLTELPKFLFDIIHLSELDIHNNPNVKLDGFDKLHGLVSLGVINCGINDIPAYINLPPSFKKLKLGNNCY